SLGVAVVGYAPGDRRAEKERPNVAQDNADAARGLAQRFWEGLLALEPMVGTYIGDDRYDDKLPDPSEDGIAKKKAFLEKSLVDRAIGQIERLLSLDPEASPGMNPVKAAAEEDRARVAKLLREEVWPAYGGYLETLRRYRPHARDTIGMLALPDGDAMYASCILSFTTLPLEAKRVHDIGLEQLAKIQDERRQIAERLGFADAPSAIKAHTESGKNTA